MSSIAQYQYDIQRYQVLKNKINTIISKLNSATDCTNNLDFEIRSTYQVNGDSASIANRSTSLKNRLVETSNYLSGTVLPAIDSSVSNAHRQIAYLEEQERRRREEEERQRQEEERRRQEAEQRSAR